MISKRVCKACNERKRFVKMLTPEYAVGEAKPPSFETGWRMNIVVCPLMLDMPLDEFAEIEHNHNPWKREQDDVEWGDYALSVASESPARCVYKLEHMLDGLPKDQAYGGEKGLQLIGMARSEPCPECGAVVVVERKNRRLVYECRECLHREWIE